MKSLMKKMSKFESSTFDISSSKYIPVSIPLKPFLGTCEPPMVSVSDADRVANGLEVNCIQKVAAVVVSKNLK